ADIACLTWSELSIGALPASELCWRTLRSLLMIWTSEFSGTPIMRALCTLRADLFAAAVRVALRDGRDRRRNPGGRYRRRRPDHELASQQARASRLARGPLPGIPGLARCFCPSDYGGHLRPAPVVGRRQRVG